MDICSIDGCVNLGTHSFGVVEVPVGPLVVERECVGGMPLSFDGVPVETATSAETESFHYVECADHYYQEG